GAGRSATSRPVSRMPLTRMALASVRGRRTLSRSLRLCYGVRPYDRNVRSEGIRRMAALNVLFIGNSFTARNDLPGLIARRAAARGHELKHRLISAGGASLRTPWNAGKTEQAIPGGSYDAVAPPDPTTLPP